jgi:hypothetical protein
MEMMRNPVFAGQRHAGWADLGGNGRRHILLQRQQLQGGILQRKPLGFAVTRSPLNSWRMMPIASSCRSRRKIQT